MTTNTALNKLTQTATIIIVNPIKFLAVPLAISCLICSRQNWKDSGVMNPNSVILLLFSHLKTAGCTGNYPFYQTNFKMLSKYKSPSCTILQYCKYPLQNGCKIESNYANWCLFHLYLPFLRQKWHPQLAWKSTGASIGDRSVFSICYLFLCDLRPDHRQKRTCWQHFCD